MKIFKIFVDKDSGFYYIISMKRDNNNQQGDTKMFGLEIVETEYVSGDDGRWEDDSWVNEQAELSATEDLVGKVEL